MNKFLTRFLLITLLGMVLVLPFLALAFSPPEPVIPNVVPQSAGELRIVINRIAAQITVFAAVVALVVAVIGGFQVLTSGGDPDKTSSGRNKIIYAAAGILVVLASWAVVNIAINLLTGVT